ncbi:hypothetical protein [Xanthovirga aplysinae]|uniref:hypothetical protein n=1 Tax=Xanthovirga aplysinae TaxID=2529853 RepID=UPI0012BCC269|nr:hypothetical protein [Xanthovirga aplysinae]
MFFKKTGLVFFGRSEEVAIGELLVSGAVGLVEYAFGGANIFVFIDLPKMVPPILAVPM